MITRINMISLILTKEYKLDFISFKQVIIIYQTSSILKSNDEYCIGLIQRKCNEHSIIY